MYIRAKEIVSREWPDNPLPTYQQFQQAAPVTSATTSEGPDGAEKMAEKVKELLAVHHTYVDVLMSMGADHLKDYQDMKAKNILARIKGGNTKC